MRERKTLEELNLSDNFLFANAMSNEGICKEFLEKLLHIEIAEIEIAKSEWTEDVYYDAKAVRFDIFVRDSAGQIYDIEMQNPNEEDLARRSRYYSSMLDTSELKKGQHYSDLPLSYVIFICTFDPFHDGRHIYSFENYCTENSKISLQDGSKKIILNTRGTMDDVSDELKDFLKYVEKSTADMASASNGSLTRHMHNIVESVKIERRVEFMTLQEMIDEEKKDSFAEGRAEGEISGAAKEKQSIAERMRAKGMSEEEISELIG
jgi:predicted transposase/invertase (TIGR01784 family)